jgi:GNAT superfamily N-acetyltransferase/predicted nucleic acid-binding protein/predicted RNA-binding protein with PUA-like domain
MSSGQIAYRVLNSFSEVSPYLSKVVGAADSDKDALGFFADSVFADFARRSLLFVLVAAESGKDIYAGHLLFDVRFPKAHVRQIFVEKRFRRQKLGEVLLDALKQHLTALQFISIHARVAEDLREANIFWEKQDFYPQRVEPGGTTKKRIIVVRAHELATPQLFESSGISAADPLGLDFRQNEAKPLFLLDLNVLFDLGPRRPRHEQAIAVFRAERMQACALAISSEIEEELKRTSYKGKTDAMHALASALPKFQIPPEVEWDRLAPDLATVVFPQRASEGRLTPNDLSDLKHLATAIHHRLPGLVTSDSSVLASAMELRRRYGIEVISPESFQVVRPDEASHEAHNVTSGHVLTFEPVAPESEAEIQALLRGLDVDISAQAANWAAVDGNRNICFRFAVKHDERVIGYLVWPRTFSGGQINACVAVAEGATAAQDAVRLMLNHLSDQVGQSEIARICLSCPPRQVIVREVSAELGYTRASPGKNELQKVVVKRIVSTENWKTTKSLLLGACDVALPDTPPTFRHVDQQIPVVRPDGERPLVSLFTLETLLAPALFCLPGRGGVLVSLEPQFADQLLQHSPQGSLLPRARAQLFRQRHYLSGPATLKAFTRGDLIFFYESGKHNGVVVALGRVIRSYHRHETALGTDDLTPSVLDADQLAAIGKAKVKTVTVFDNLLLLPQAISREELIQLGCGEPHQLQTSQRLTPQQVQGILWKGLR